MAQKKNYTKTSLKYNTEILKIKILQKQQTGKQQQLRIQFSAMMASPRPGYF
jgi:hypothetical protein